MTSNGSPDIITQETKNQQGQLHLSVAHGAACEGHPRPPHIRILGNVVTVAIKAPERERMERYSKEAQHEPGREKEQEQGAVPLPLQV